MSDCNFKEFLPIYFLSDFGNHVGLGVKTVRDPLKVSLGMATPLRLITDHAAFFCYAKCTTTFVCTGIAKSDAEANVNLKTNKSLPPCLCLCFCMLAILLLMASHRDYTVLDRSRRNFVKCVISLILTDMRSVVFDSENAHCLHRNA